MEGVHQKLIVVPKEEFLKHAWLWLIPLALFIAFRFRYSLTRWLQWVLFAPPPNHNRRIMPTERCWACGAKDGKLEAVKQPLPESKEEALLVKHTCNVCGAVQHFSGIVAHPSLQKMVDDDVWPIRVGAIQPRDQG